MENYAESLIVSEMKKGGIDFVVSVPCKLTDKLLKQCKEDDDIIYLSVTREEEGIGICAGAFLGGRHPCIIMQNSGLGNSINAIASLTQYYRMPLAIIISHRGTHGEKIGAQFPMGQITGHLLEALNIPILRPRDVKQIETEFAAFINHSTIMQQPVAVLFDFQFWRAVS